eukprot:COSAG01_NODE_9058_length_2565_cov_1.029173_2_plen_258_part_00
MNSMVSASLKVSKPNLATNRPGTRPWPLCPDLSSLRHRSRSPPCPAPLCQAFEVERQVRRPLRPFRRPSWLRFTYVTSVLDKKYVRARSGWTTSARRSRRSARNPRSPPGSECRAPPPPHRCCAGAPQLLSRARLTIAPRIPRHTPDEPPRAAVRHTMLIGAGTSAIYGRCTTRWRSARCCSSRPPKTICGSRCALLLARCARNTLGTATQSTRRNDPLAVSPCFCSLPSRMDRCLGQVLEKFDETLVNAGVGYMAD